MSITSTLAAATGALLLTSLPVRAGEMELSGKCLLFDGQDDLVRVPYDPAFDLTEAFTLEAWVLTGDDNGGIAGVWGSGGLTDMFILEVRNGHFIGTINRAHAPFGHLMIEGDPVTPGVWSHVALSFDGENVTLYVDGQVSAKADYVGELVSAPRDLVMGERPDNLPDPYWSLQGALDEVRLWDHARTEQEIARFHNHALHHTASGLVGVWSFDEKPLLQQALDESAGAHHGTLGADELVGPDDPLRLPSNAPLGWKVYGGGVGGALGVPSLLGGGTLQPGQDALLELTGAPTNSPAAFVLGYSALGVWFKGGAMIPTVDVLVPGLMTDGLGEISMTTPWPAMPPGSDVFIQYWIVDDTAVLGYSGSHALWVEAP